MGSSPIISSKDSRLVSNVKRVILSVAKNPENISVARVAITLWILPLRQARGQNDGTYS